EAPVLATLIALVLRYNESGKYDFASAYHIPSYLFLMLVVAMFLGLTNSADDIVRDRVLLQRERNLKIRLPYYILAKFVTLCLFALFQCVLFVLIGNWLLQVRGMFWIYLGYDALTACCGVALGLLVSSLVSDAKTAVNLVPLILIPQIIMSGALIKYEEMNKNLDFVYTVRKWFAQHPPPGQEKGSVMPPSKLEVPLLCQFLPTRWSYEGIIVAQAKLNPLTRRQDALQAQIQALADRGATMTSNELDQLENLKEMLATLSGLEASTARGVDRDLAAIDRQGMHPVLEGFELPARGSGVSAEQLYVNQKVSDLVSKAEMEQSDYRRDTRTSNIFFGLQKKLRQWTVSVHLYNSVVLTFFVLLVLGMLHGSLRRQLRS
ncbi:MAG: ABC transporter permease, partial [Verrucomicrobia bacterium]|nr:ABC transporter permease [Verrucomicrobiota bacterium]